MTIVEKFSVTESAPLAHPSIRNPELAATSSKLLGLELLRFAAATAVLFYHYKHFSRVPGAAAAAGAGFPFAAWLWPLYSYGQFGVQLFWGISGYIFFWKYGRAIHTGAVSAARFFWLRFSRLYPLHFVTLILVAGLQLAHRQLTGEIYVFPANGFGEFVRQLFLATDWGAQPSQTFNAPIWSVSAEVAVYAAFFLLLRRYPPSLKLCASIVAGGMALLLCGFKPIPVICAIFFFAGGLAASFPPLSPYRRFLAASFAIAIFGAAALTGVLHDPFLVPWVILATLPFLLAAVAGELPGFDRWQRGIEVAGNLTYSTYLLHFPLQLTFAIGVATTGIRVAPADPLLLVAYLAVTMIVSAISYRALELPAQAWIRRRRLGSTIGNASNRQLQ